MVIPTEFIPASLDYWPRFILSGAAINRDHARSAVTPHDIAIDNGRYVDIDTCSACIGKMGISDDCAA